MLAVMLAKRRSQDDSLMQMAATQQIEVAVGTTHDL